MDKPLLVVRRSHWNYLWHYAFSFLIVPFFIAFFKRRMVKLRIFPERIVLEQGLLSKDLKLLFISDIRTIDVRQTIIQRIFRMGDLLVATSGTSEYETIVEGFPNPEGIKDLILEQRALAVATPEEDDDEIDETLLSDPEEDGA